MIIVVVRALPRAFATLMSAQMTATHDFLTVRTSLNDKVMCPPVEKNKKEDNPKTEEEVGHFFEHELNMHLTLAA